LGPDGLPVLHRRLSVDYGGEELGFNEPIDPLETLAFWAIAVAGLALVIQQHLQIVSKLVHDREFIIGRMHPAIKYI
jgi:hypothetical protein